MAPAPPHCHRRPLATALPAEWNTSKRLVQSAIVTRQDDANAICLGGERATVAVNPSADPVAAVGSVAARSYSPAMQHPIPDGHVVVGRRRLELEAATGLVLAADEWPSEVGVAVACACGRELLAQGPLTHHSHDEDRVTAREITFVGRLSPVCPGCSRTLRFEVLVDVREQRLSPGRTLAWGGVLHVEGGRLLQPCKMVKQGKPRAVGPVQMELINAFTDAEGPIAAIAVTSLAAADRNHRVRVGDTLALDDETWRIVRIVPAAGDARARIELRPA